MYENIIKSFTPRLKVVEENSCKHNKLLGITGNLIQAK